MINGIFGNEAAFYRSYEQIQNFIRVFYEQAKAEQPYDIGKHAAVIGYVLVQTHADLSHLPTPSIFKKAAQFTLNFVIHTPISTELPKDYYLPELSHRNFQNALLAFEICRSSMHKAQVIRTDGKVCPVKVAITPSDHQMKDILKCLSTIQRVEESYDTYARLLALMYESLCYEFNNDIRYPPPAMHAGIKSPAR